MAITASMVKELREITSAGMMDCKKALTETNGDIDAAVKLLREQGLLKNEKKSGRITAEGIAQFSISDDGKSGAIVEVNSETDFVAKNEEFKKFVNKLAEMVLSGNYKDLESFKQANYDGNDTVETALGSLIAKIGENMSLRRINKLEVSEGIVSGYLHAGGKIAVLVSLSSKADKKSLENLGKDVSMQVASMNPRFLSTNDVDDEYIKTEKEVLMHQAMNEGKPANIAEKMVEGRLKKQFKEACLLEQDFVKDGDITVKALIEQTSKEIGSPIEVVSFIRYEVGEGIEKKEENFAEEVAKQMGK